MKGKGSPLDRLSSMEMAKRPAPTIHLRGKHAKAFHGMKPGQKVHAHLHGTVQGTGMDQYNDNEPTAEISLDSIAPHDKAMAAKQDEQD